jgi:hypothetical protein
MSRNSFKVICLYSDADTIAIAAPEAFSAHEVDEKRRVRGYDKISKYTNIM